MMVDITQDKQYGTLWLKKKSVTIKKGDRKGEEIEIMSGSVHIGGGKMIKFTVYPDQSPVEKDGDHLFPIKFNKWKGDAPSSRSRSRKAW